MSKTKKKYKSVIGFVNSLLDGRGAYKKELEEKIAKRFGLKEITAKNYVWMILRDFEASLIIEKLGGENNKAAYFLIKKNNFYYPTADKSQIKISDYAEKDVICL